MSGAGRDGAGDGAKPTRGIAPPGLWVTFWLGVLLGLLRADALDRTWLYINLSGWLVIAVLMTWKVRIHVG